MGNSSTKACFDIARRDARRFAATDSVNLQAPLSHIESSHHY